MLKKHQIKKIIKQMVPSSVYSNPQRKMLRETAKTELYDYITKYPDATYANLQQQFCDNEIINSKQMLILLQTIWSRRPMFFNFFIIPYLNITGSSFPPR